MAFGSSSRDSKRHDRREQSLFVDVPQRRLPAESPLYVLVIGENGWVYAAALLTSNRQNPAEDGAARRVRTLFRSDQHHIECASK
jgi:hypothetical protein